MLPSAAKRHIRKYIMFNWHLLTQDGHLYRSLLANPSDLAIVSLVRGILCVQVSPSVRVRRVLTRRVTESLKAAKVQVAHLVR